MPLGGSAAHDAGRVTGRGFRQWDQRRQSAPPQRARVSIRETGLPAARESHRRPAPSLLEHAVQSRYGGIIGRDQHRCLMLPAGSLRFPCGHYRSSAWGDRGDPPASTQRGVAAWRYAAHCRGNWLGVRPGWRQPGIDPVQRPFRFLRRHTLRLPNSGRRDFLDLVLTFSWVGAMSILGTIAISPDYFGAGGATKVAYR